MSSQLRELERRLEREPSNLGLRVQVAGLMHQAGRTVEAVELYRSVALAYRDQGRRRQAVAVCHSILEIAPDDAACRELLETMAEPDEPTPLPARATPARRSSFEETPLPGAVPYHVHDPTSSAQRVRPSEALPAMEGETTRPGETPRPVMSGLAEAARHITGLIAGADAAGPHTEDDVASELDTRKRPRIASDELAKIAAPPPTVPLERVDLGSAERAVGTGESGASESAETVEPNVNESTYDRQIVTPPPDEPRDSEEELTSPRDLPSGVRTRDTARTILDGAFFAPLPPDRRAIVLARFTRKTVAAATVVVRQGEANHPLFVVVRGRLDQRLDRDGKTIELPSIGAGEYVGEAALLARVPAGAQVVAAIETELLVLAARDVYELAGAYPALWAELKATAERRTREQARR